MTYSSPDHSTASTTSGDGASTIHAVLFDYGQVLSLGPNQAAWQRMQDVIGAKAEGFHDAYWTFRHDYDRGTLSGTAYWQAVAEYAGRPSLNDSELNALYAADVDLWTDLNLPMLDWAQQLQRSGIRTGILSNIGDRMESGIRAKFDWVEQFAHCTWSHSLKMAKPETAIYQHSAEGLGIAHEHILFIDDREENIAAAVASGMMGIHYTSHEAFLRELQRFNLDPLAAE